MAMVDPQVLLKEIAAGRTAPVYVIYGEDGKRVAQIVDALEGTIDPADRPFAVDRFHAGESKAAPVDVVAAARSLPMLGDRRVVIVLRAERWLKPKRAAKAADPEDGADADDAGEESADLAPIEEYLAAPVPSTMFVFVATEIDRGRRLTKLLLKAACVAECGWPSVEKGGAAAAREARAAASALVQAEAVAAGRAIDPAAAQMLVQRVGTDIGRLRADLERLWLYTEGQARVTAEDVAEVMSSEEAADDPWAVVNAIASGDAGRALRETARRLDAGDSVHALLGQLRWWVSSRLAEGDPGRVRAAIDVLLRTDLALKSSGGDERVLVERAVVELTGRPLPPQRGWR